MTSIVMRAHDHRSPGILATSPTLLDAGVLQPVEDVHQILIQHAAVAAQVHLLVGRRLHLLSDALLQHVDADLLVAEIDRCGSAGRSAAP